MKKRKNDNNGTLVLVWVLPLMLIGVLMLWANHGTTTKENVSQLKTLEKDEHFVDVNVDSLYNFLQNSNVFKNEIRKVKCTKTVLQFSYDTNCNLFFHEGIAHDTSMATVYRNLYTVKNGTATITLKVKDGYAHVPAELLESILNPQY